MKSILSCAAIVLASAIGNIAHAQPTQSLSVQRLILDDKNGHKVTIMVPEGLPTITGDYVIQLPDHADTLITRLELKQNPLAVNGGGTGNTHYAIGDILYASADSTLSIIDRTGAVSGKMLSLQSDGAGHLVPQWISAGGVGSVSGTAGEITASPTTGDVVVGLATVSTVTPGTYTMPDVTVDSKGRVTAIKNSTAGGGGIYCGETTSKLANGVGTNYFFPMGPSSGNGTTNAVGVSKTICPRTGILVHFFVLLDAPVNGTVGDTSKYREFRIVDETSGDYLSAKIGAGQTAANSGDTTFHFHTIAGDVIHVEQTGGTGGALGTPIATWAFEIQVRALPKEMYEYFKL